MPGYNHYPDCLCGWCYKTRRTPSARSGFPRASGASGLRESYTVPNAECPVCGAGVWFYRSPFGGRVFFDSLGPPWPKHPCTDNGATPKGYVRSDDAPVRAPAWAKDGWLPSSGILLGDTGDGWRGLSVYVAGPRLDMHGLIMAGMTPPDGNPLLVKPLDPRGIGKVSWIAETGEPVSRAFVHPIFRRFARETMVRASKGETDAVIELAGWLWAKVETDMGADWLDRLDDQTLSILRTWVNRAARAGDQGAAERLVLIGKGEARRRERRESGAPLPCPADPRLEPDTDAYRAYTRMFDITEQLGKLPGKAALLNAERLQEGFLRASSTCEVTGDEEYLDLSGALVTLLLDNSGSMRGAKALAVMMLATKMAAAIVAAGGKVEILGFTTGTWKGGQSRKLWSANGKPKRPGRLCDLRHVIFKSWDEPWNDDVAGRLGLMFEPDYLKENLDGEALVWAYRRSLAAPVRKRCIMLIGDGAPMDDSTLSYNPGSYLQDHMSAVVDAIIEQGLVCLCSLGIGSFRTPVAHAASWEIDDPTLLRGRTSGAKVNGFPIAWKLLGETLHEEHEIPQHAAARFS